MSACLQVSRERLKIKRNAFATMPKDSVILALKDRSLLCFSGKENKHEEMYYSVFTLAFGRAFALLSMLSMLMPCSTVLKLFIKRFRASFSSKVTLLPFRRAFSFL